jgi:hypothetical protein
MSWFNEYTEAQNVSGTPHGRVNLRGNIAGGLKIGKAPSINNTPFSGQSNSKIVSIAQYNASTTSTGVIVMLDITTPSSRLTAGVQVFVERDDVIDSTPVAAGAVPAVATLYALALNPLTGGRNQMQVLSTINPPFVYQIDPAYKAVRLALALDYRNFAYSATFGKGTLKVAATWEPNVEMESFEVNRLQSLCSISIPTPIQL